MGIAGPQNLVDDVAVVGQKNQSFRVLIKPSDRKEPFRILQIADDVVGDLFIRGADDARRLIQRDIDRLDFASDHPPIQLDYIARRNTITGSCGTAINRNATFLDETVGFAAGTDSRLTDVLVETGGGADANFFVKNGIKTVNLGTGMREFHTINEKLILKEFIMSANIVLRSLLRT